MLPPPPSKDLGPELTQIDSPTHTPSALSDCAQHSTRAPKDCKLNRARTFDDEWKSESHDLVDDG